jgi:hypothetical protein
VTQGGPEPDDPGLVLDRERLRLEEQRLDGEHRRAIWTPLSIFASILIAGASLAYQDHQQNHQQRADARAARIQQEAAAGLEADRQNAAFTLAAAQVVMAAPSCEVAAQRAAWMVVLFPNLLPRNFARSVDQIRADTFGSVIDPSATSYPPGSSYTLSSSKAVQKFLAQFKPSDFRWADTSLFKGQAVPPRQLSPGSYFDLDTGTRVPRDIACDQLRRLRAKPRSK